MEVYNPQNDGSYQQEEQQQQNQYPNLPNGMLGSRPITQDQDFMKWLFSFRKEVIDPLRYIWRGYEFDHDEEKWIKIEGEGVTPIMNNKGISWCISLIESYVNPVFVVSNFDEKFLNYTMKLLCKDVWNSLSLHYKEYELRKSDIPRVCNEIESKVLALLLGAKNDGFREFFTRQQLYHRQDINSINSQAKQSAWNGVFGMFKRNNQQ